MTMTVGNCFGSYVLLLTVITLSVIEAADPAVHDTFLKCLTENTKTASGELSKIVFAQNNPSFTTVLQKFARNKRFVTAMTPKPVLIFTPLEESHVQGAVICAKTAKLEIRIRSGGHDYAGISYVSKQTFMVLDMSKLNAITIDVKNEVAVVQPGATTGELYYRIWEKSKVHGFSSAVCPTVGLGGHISGGGYGNMLRSFGLTVDNVIDAKIVDVKGNLLDKKGMGEDLFWAIRGGGGASFGVVVSFTIKLLPVPEKVTIFRSERSWDSKTADFVLGWQKVASVTDKRLFMRLMLLPEQKTLKATIVALFLGGADEVVSLLGKEFPLLELKKENCSEVSWIESVMWWNDPKSLENGDKPETLLDRKPNTGIFLKRKSDYVEKGISKEGWETIFKSVVELGETGIHFNPYGGKMDEIAPDATPFPHRKGNMFKLQYNVNWVDPSIDADKNYTKQAKKLFNVMTPYVSKNPRRAFFCYRDINTGVNTFGQNSYKEGEVYGTKYFGSNFERLVKVKTAVDPQNFFRNEQSIPVLNANVSMHSLYISYHV
ncbi:CO dehydrogenase flavoprotein-like [Vigna unguiculata]|uniref:CO dehydrogenase flavoprotein-like n=1 Tax=Vigna unguiculata TaxID=3917 RepID=A0A4D6KLA8_VIGUN|nr:CO dehydrogenase flavoprotein-like [Vigna unguiculata]